MKPTLRSNGAPVFKGISMLKVSAALVVAAMPHVGLITPGQASAQTIDETLDTGGKARVNRSASLRSLTEAVASASCRVNAGIATETARADLSSSRQDFDRIINGLMNGDPALGMPGAERRAKSLEVLNATNALWNPLSEAAERLATGPSTPADVAAIDAGFEDLFEQTVQTAAVISGQYANPQQLLQSDATVLNFAVRQRALAYRMTRAICELHTGVGSADTVQELQSSVDMFQQTLLALRDGLPAAGINPPPNDTIYNSLSATLEFWTAQRGVFDAALAGETPTQDQVRSAALLTEALSVAMNNTITLYLIATPGQDGVYRIPLEAYAQDELKGWLSEPGLIDAIKAQNAKHDGLSEDDVIALDQQWRAEAGAGGGQLITELLSAPMSQWLKDQQDATAGFVTEVFVMDNKGLNVAQSAQTSDYWQGDEAKWQETYLVGSDAMHISEVEFDDSTGFYQSQASLPITDPATGEVIGAVTFGINVQSLM